MTQIHQEPLLRIHYPKLSQTMAATPDLKCARCGATGHLAAACKLSFHRPLCSFCGRLGHIASDCAVKDKADLAQRKAAHKARCEQERLERENQRKQEEKQLREVKVWCWHCGGLGHTKKKSSSG